MVETFTDLPARGEQYARSIAGQGPKRKMVRSPRG